MAHNNRRLAVRLSRENVEWDGTAVLHVHEAVNVVFVLGVSDRQGVLFPFVLCFIGDAFGLCLVYAGKVGIERNGDGRSERDEGTIERGERCFGTARQLGRAEVGRCEPLCREESRRDRR